jgi:hypothetical protein
MEELSRALGAKAVPATLPRGPTPGSVEAPAIGGTRLVTPPPPTTLSAGVSVIERELTPRLRSRRRGPLIVVTLAVAAAAGYLVFSRGQRAPVTAPVVPPVAVPARPSVEPPAPKTPPTITVKLTSEPPGARVVRERDGALIGVTPLQESWPSSSGSEKVRLEEEGYQPESLIVPLDLGVDLAFHLKPAAAPPSHKHASHHAASGSSKKPPAQLSPNPPAPPAVAPPAPAPPKPAAPPKAEPVPL